MAVTAVIDGSAGKIRTDAPIHHTIETGNHSTTLRSDVPDCEVDGIMPLVRSALDDNVVSFPPAGFVLEVDPDFMTQRGTMGA